MSKLHSKTSAQYNAAGNISSISDFATDGFFSYSFDYLEANFDFSDETFVALSLESTSSARGGNGGGGGGKKDKPGDDPVDPPVDPVDPPVDPNALDSYTSGSDDGSGYNIDIVFEGDGWTVELQAAFIESAEFLSDIIVGDRPDYIEADDPNNFFNQDIDDVLITATLSNIDGEGGILGQAGPTHIIYDPATESNSDALPFAGVMEFDIADAETYLTAGTWGDIVFHEMVHTLGFGTLWERTGVVDLMIDDNGTRKPTDDSYVYDYTGAYASSLTDDPLTTDIIESPIVETDGGSGTAGGHWDEQTYDNELMTGYIDDPNYLSQMSMASLGDLGYVLDWTGTTYTDLELV